MYVSSTVLVAKCVDLDQTAWAGPEGGQGVRTRLENHKNIGFLSNTGPDPLKNYKATKPALNFGLYSVRQRNAI